jgi:hypothetical protein
LLAQERARKRQELLAATEKLLDGVQAATRRTKQPLKGKEKIGLRVGKIINRFKMAKHFITEIEERNFAYHRDQDSLQASFR